ncbi:MAG: hypothetical protein A2Z12_08460 [Actinobacteria bacterium RBG_16_68_21]|nr:MAG: hypothetical protein A2Z12_08460 [Actinobacteria bacterium RBG_16_68_21]
MILPPGFVGAAFGDAADGDPRRDPEAGRRLSARLGIPPDWAWLRQVHGAVVLRADGAGPLGEGDAAFTTRPGLPIAVATADCFPVVIEGDGGTGIAHAGWRGAAAGVVGALRQTMSAAGIAPRRAAIGPGIGACCFEVGLDVADRFPGRQSTTAWGTSSVDLRGELVAALDGLDVWMTEACTMSDVGYHSFRRDGTALRQVAVAWLPD